MKKILPFAFLFMSYITLYSQVENDDVRNSATESISFNFCSLEEACNLEIYNGLIDWVSVPNISHSGGQVISADNEEDIGAITIANKNDTDGDGIIDNIDINGVIDNNLGRNEIDLMKLVLKKPIPDNGGSVILSVVSGNIKLWNNPNKTSEISVASGNVSYSTSQLDKTIFIEVIQESGSVRDIELKMQYNGNEDIVKATGVWVTNTMVWRNNSSMPVAGEGVLSNIDEANILERINERWISKNDNRYGHGNCFRSQLSVATPTGNQTFPSGEDKRFGGRILFEFQILPNDLTTSNLKDFVFYDVTRQKKNRFYKIISGGILGGFETGNSVNFPWEGGILTGSPLDVELPNDDMNPNDEDNTPTTSNTTSNLLYSFDPPSTDILDFEDELLAYKVNMVTFKEFARIRLMNDFPDLGQNIVSGSRSSGKVDWHCVYYVRRANNNTYKMEIDAAPVSLSFPIKSGVGNGNISFLPTSLPANTPTMGYRVEFEGNKWKLHQNNGLPGTPTPIESNESNNGPWTINFNQISLTITSGNQSYFSGDQYTFSVFNTMNPNGKQNIINTSTVEFDVTINP